MYLTNILDCTVQTMMLVLVLSLPPIVVASVVGILVGLFQAVTQIQEQTLSFALKLVAVIVTILVTARWIGGELFHFTEKLFILFPALIR